MWTALLGLALALDPATPAPTAADLGWLTGTWVSESDGKRVEETWTTAAGGTLFGVNRSSKGDLTTFHEFLRIEPHDGTLVYVALPKGAKAETPFTAAEHGEGWARFTNPDHDFPTSLRYTRTADHLKIEVRGPDGKGFDLELDKQPQ
jgi:hypothetical protein